jgi:hypothetical protein
MTAMHERTGDAERRGALRHDGDIEARTRALEDWEVDSRRLWFGFVGPDNGWVPGITSTVARLVETAEADRKVFLDAMKVNRRVDSWILRGIAVVIGVKFLGFEHWKDVVGLFH